jgi:2-C-methyl-D-erythritol 4-phosphate cytidylyltransferase
MSEDKPRPIYAIVPAAGSGQRFGGPIPKQYLPLSNMTVIEHSLQRLLPRVDRMVVALADDDQVFQGLSIASHPKVEVVVGGDSRSESVQSALSQLNIGADDWVLIHDAVRPLVSKQDLQNLINSLQYHPVGGLLASPVYDTVKRADEERQVLKTEDRHGLWLAQTPQMFRYRKLSDALAKAGNDDSLTDESMAVEKAGYTVRLVEGSRINFKITRPEDLQLAEMILARAAEQATHVSDRGIN